MTPEIEKSKVVPDFSGLVSSCSILHDAGKPRRASRSGSCKDCMRSSCHSACIMQACKTVTAFMLLQKRLVDLSKLKKLERLRLANVTSSALLVRPQRKIAVKQWGYSALPSPVCTSADYDIHMATWVLKTNM